MNCVRFNEESTVVMSGSVDTLVKIWDCRARSQEPIQQLEDCKVRCATLMSTDLTFLLFLPGSWGEKLKKNRKMQGNLYLVIVILLEKFSYRYNWTSSMVFCLLMSNLLCLFQLQKTLNKVFKQICYSLIQITIKKPSWIQIRLE